MARLTEVGIALWKIVACGEAECTTTNRLVVDELAHLCAPQALRIGPVIAMPLAPGRQL